MSGKDQNKSPKEQAADIVMRWAVDSSSRNNYGKLIDAVADALEKAHDAVPQDYMLVASKNIAALRAALKEEHEFYQAERDELALQASIEINKLRAERDALKNEFTDVTVKEGRLRERVAELEKVLSEKANPDSE